MIRVEALADGEVGAWGTYVDAHPDATFFHLAGWRTVYATALRHRPHYLVAWRDQQVVGVLPLVHVRSRIFGSYLSSLPFLVYGGPLADDDAARTALLAAAEALGQRLGVRHVELRCIAAGSIAWPAGGHYVTFRRPIVADDDANMKAIPRKQRAMIRKGEQAGLAIDHAPDVPRFYDMMAASYHSLGTPLLGQGYFRALLDVFGERVEFTHVAWQGQPVASVLSFRFRDEILPYYGGGTPAARECKANDYMYWAVMQRAAAAGVTRFDFGRSREGTGSYAFKKHWGFEPEPLDYRYMLVRDTALPDHSPSNAKFELAIRMWKRLPLGLTRLLGPPIARQLA